MASNITSSVLTTTEAVSSVVTAPSSTFITTSTAVITSTVPITTSTPSTTTTRTTTSTTPVTSAAAPVTTSTIIASSATPTSTDLVTSTIAVSAAGTTSQVPVVVTVTASQSTTSDSGTTTSQTSSSAAASSTNATLTGNGSSNSGSSGLSPGGVTAIAVVVPVVVVALLVILGIFLWRRRKQRKALEEQRRKEVEDYGYNPNNDPTIPVVAAADPEMSEDNSGYRGWGAATASNRKASTTLSGGHAQQLSDGGSAGYATSSPHYSDGNSGTGLMDNRRQTMGSDDFTAAPIAAGAAGAALAPGAMRRGASNASSRYSGGAISNHSEEPVPQIPQSYENQGYGYAQHGPYGDGSYNGGQQGMPVVRDVSARRNTRIQQAGHYQQGNSGISQNF